MARFSIISKDGKSVRYSGKMRYIGTYMKPSYIEFGEVSSPSPIAWEVGDYVDYGRTGMRYYLYSIPQPTKNARARSYGAAFTYPNVQLYAATKDLEIALFRDLVDNDNGIHFSTSPDVATSEDVRGIARRIQACMDDLYPGKWRIAVADFDDTEDAAIIESITMARDFALSGGTCLDALSKIYELWDDLGWIHSYDEDSGQEVITIGYANKRIDDNTTGAYLYGRGNGLTAIKRNQLNKNEFATRLYVYGSERNLPSRYYNGLSIANAESVDIRNLMIPLAQWGRTDGAPDARKAYIENAEAVAKYGVIPKVHYFDSPESGADIYPSIEGVTINQLRIGLAALGKTQYSPKPIIYPDINARVDEVLAAANPVDNGRINVDGSEYDFIQNVSVSGSTTSDIIPSGSTEGYIHETQLFSATLPVSGMGDVTLVRGLSIKVPGGSMFKSVVATIIMTDSTSDRNRRAYSEHKVSFALSDSGYWEAVLPKISASYTYAQYAEMPLYVNISIDVVFSSSLTSDTSISYVIESSEVIAAFKRLMPKTFTIDIKQIGFDIDLQATLGEGKVISMKTGKCAGRDFVIDSCDYYSETDSWRLNCYRQQDDTLGMLFPNSDYQIAEGDRFVLLEIAMPEVYITTAMSRLLAEGNKLLASASKVLSHYEPSIDAKVMVESGRILREGMYMDIVDEDVVDNGEEFILIDSLTIYEDEDAIPTYRVTLREKKKITYKGTPSTTSSTSTRSVGSSSFSDSELADIKTRLASLEQAVFE